MNTLQSPAEVEKFLTELNFKQNGYDFWKQFAVTNLETDWEEEVYVSLTAEGYQIWYPDRENRNKTYKTAKGMMKFINRHHS